MTCTRPLRLGFTYNGAHLTRDAANIAQGDNFLSIVMPEIEARKLIKTTARLLSGGMRPRMARPEPHALAKSSFRQMRRATPIPTTYTHSSDLLTMQEIFNVGACLLGACDANDLSDLFKPDSVPNQITTNLVPEPESALLLTGGLFCVTLTRRNQKFVSR
jgi:phosphatidylinositol-3-phosphatase